MNNNPARTESKIRGAINKAAILVAQDDLHPNDAMVKAADHYRLNPEMTCRAVEALNIALTRSHLKTATDKTDSHPIADRATVLKMAFVDAPVGEPEAPPEADVWDTGGSFQVTSKSAGHKVAEVAPAPRDINDLIEQTRGYEERKLAEIGRLEVDSLGVQDTIIGEAQKLAGLFRQSAHRDSFGTFAEEAYAEYGKRAEGAIGLVHKHANFEGDPPGCPEGLRVQPFYTYGNSVDGIGRLLAGRVKFAEIEAERAALVGEVGAKLASLHETVARIGGAEPAPARESAADMLKGAGLKKDKKKLEKERTSYDLSHESADKDTARADSKADRKMKLEDRRRDKREKSMEGNKAMFGSIMERAGLASPADSIQGGPLAADYDAAIVDKARSERVGGIQQGDLDEMDQMRRSGVLQDLMINDPILSQQDPQQVARAYETFVRLSPQAALIPDVARGVLRNAIAAQAVDPYAAKELLGLEKSLAGPGEEKKREE